jgi:hypothetical protein
LMTLSTRLWKLPKSTSKKQNIYNILLINMTQSCQIKQRYTFHLHPAFIEELKYRIFRSALIHVLTHFQQTTCSQIYFRFSSYLLRKPHLFIILTAIEWFIVNIQSDLFWHRCLERPAFGTTRMYTLSPSKSINQFKCIREVSYPCMDSAENSEQIMNILTKYIMWYFTY